MGHFFSNVGQATPSINVMCASHCQPNQSTTESDFPTLQSNYANLNLSQLVGLAAIESN